MSDFTIDANETVELTGVGDPIEKIFRGETVDAVRSVLAEMTAESVAVLVFKYVDGHTVSQIVEVSGGNGRKRQVEIGSSTTRFQSAFRTAAFID